MTRNTKKNLAKFKQVLPFVILALLVASYIAFFSMLAIDKHNRFQSLAFDLGIYDQAIWQYSHFKTPFNTVRGLHILGDHFTLINVLVSPLYWFVDDVRALLMLQTIVLAAGAIPAYLIARQYFKNDWIPLVFSFAYLMFPALQYVNLEDYHPEAFIPVFLLFAFYFVMRDKKWQYLLFFFLTLLTKEEIAVTTFLLGIYIYFKHDKKLGAFTSIVSLAWFIAATKWFIPFFNGGSYLYSGYVLQGMSSSPWKTIFELLNPVFLFHLFVNPANGKYVMDLFAPVGFLALLNPLTLLIAGALWINLISSWPYAHNIQYHYVAATIPFIFISLIIGIARYKKQKTVLCALLAILVICAVASNYYLAPYDSSMKNAKSIANKINRFNLVTDSEMQAYALIGMIPPNASVSASYDILPHLTHRDEAYNFPNPFKSHYWGSGKEEYPAKLADYLLLRNAHVEEHAQILQPLLDNNTYRTIKKTENFELFARETVT